ncbi:MAG: radical SAM protein [Planctomycetota bacterium]|nr:radical SAM protein [Planctomycetota bacterium]
MTSSATLSPAPSRRGVRPDPRLEPVRVKVDRGQRLSLDDGRILLTTPDIWSVLQLADLVRRRLHANVAFYNVNRHLNYSNVCALSCKFCDFYAKQGQAKAYTRDMQYVRDEATKAVDAGATEIHSVGGLHPSLPFSYYTDLVWTIRDQAAKLGSDLHVKAFTAVEIVHLCKIAKVYKGASAPGEEGRRARREAIAHVLAKLKEAGLGSLPGGGAEVFDDRVHDEAFKGKIRSDVWLDVHRVAHELGLNTNATLLYGHVERPEDRLVHLDMLRRAQDEALARLGYASELAPATGVAGDSRPSHTELREQQGEFTAADDALTRSEGGHLGYRGDDSAFPVITLTRPGTPLPEHVAFAAGHAPQAGYYQTIIPLPFFPDGSELEHLPGPAGLENYRTLAVARLMLDNFPHVKAFWIMQTLPMAQIMLQSGADDIDGTVVWYDITKLNHAGTVGGASGNDGVATHQEVNVWTLQKAIREAGFIPVERDTLYRRVIRDPSDGRKWSVA